ncbi:MAG: hypothetical protein M1836_002176 [Candelina mexicana]|nr:MAG: hypothetical protein M1836_002176 [Candelina mexicana]
MGEHVHAFLTGRAFQRAKLSWKLAMRQSGAPPVGAFSIFKIRYCASKIAWSSEGERYLMVYDFLTGKTKRFLPENRQIPRLITLSSSVVGAISTLGRGRTLAILLSVKDSGGSVMHWNFDSRATQSFELPSKASVSRRLDWRKLLIHPTAAFIFLFEQTSDAALGAGLQHAEVGISEGDNIISYTKYTFGGNVVSEGFLTYRTCLKMVYPYWQTYPTDFEGCFTLCSGSRVLAGDTDSAEAFQIRFNTRTSKLQLTRSFFELGITSRLESSQIDPPLADTTFILHWKDAIFISQVRYDEKHQVQIVRPDKSCSQVAEFSQYIGADQQLNDGTWLFGDECILVQAGPSGFIAWSFDKNIQLANEDMEYRNRRNTGIHGSIL